MAHAPGSLHSSWIDLVTALPEAFQDIGVQPAVIPVGGLPEITEITLIFAVTIEARLMIIATLDDVLGNTGMIETRLSCRALLPCGKACHADAVAAKKLY
jgi:hypothetical protein